MESALTIQSENVAMEIEIQRFIEIYNVLMDYGTEVGHCEDSCIG